MTRLMGSSLRRRVHHPRVARLRAIGSFGVSTDRRVRQLSAILLLTALAALAVSASAPGASPPGREVYTDPGPVPAPDSVAEEFVEKSAPALGNVTPKQLERGLVVEDKATSAQPPEPPANVPATERRDWIVPAATVVDGEVLQRAGVKGDGTGFDAWWGALVAAVLAFAGFAAIASPPRRLRRAGAS